MRRRALRRRYGHARRLSKTNANRLRALVRDGHVDTKFRGYWDPLVDLGLATRERLPYEYSDVYRFKPTAAGKAVIA